MKATTIAVLLLLVGCSTPVPRDTTEYCPIGYKVFCEEKIGEEVCKCMSDREFERFRDYWLEERDW